jgi:hypothetical protein
MICQLRLFGLVWELLWVNGFLLGITFPGFGVQALGINLGPFALCIWRDAEPPTCRRCGRTLKWGLHGDLFGIPLCRPVSDRCLIEGCGRPVSPLDYTLCEFHAHQRCPHHK